MKTQEGVKELRRMWGGFWSSRVLLTANNFRVFDHLEAPKNAGEVARAVKADKRAVELLLDALTGLGMLKKSAGRYRNTEVARTFLVRGKPYYQGDIIKHADILWKNWSGLDEAVKTGRPVRAARDQESFIMGMHNIASLKSKDVIAALDLKGVKRALDLGGGPGTYSMALATKGIRVTLFDMPDTIRIAQKVIKKAGAMNIDFIRGDFMTGDIGSGYDLVFISQIVHAYSASGNIGLIKKCRDVLNPGGRIAIQEFYLDKSRTHPPQSALFAINMLVNTEGGRCYSPAEMKQWLARAGFRNAREKMLEDTVLITAKKEK